METRNVDEVLTTRELADRLGVCARTIANWVRQRNLPTTRIGKTLRFCWRHVQRWLDEQTSSGGGPGHDGGVVVG
jgi:excisionase family DNA binding protein